MRIDADTERTAFGEQCREAFTVRPDQMLHSRLLRACSQPRRVVQWLAPLAADRAWNAAYFVVARGRKACPLASPQHGGARSGSSRFRSSTRAGPA